MRTIVYAAAKGGQGCSTIAAISALAAARHTHTLLVSWETFDQHAVLGAPRPTDSFWPTQVTDNLQLVTADWYLENIELLDCWDLVIHDYGYIEPGVADGFDMPGELIWVTRPCYLAIAKLAALNDISAKGLVVINEPGRSLTARDIGNAASLPVLAQVPFDPAVSRAIDSGLLASRVPKSMQPIAAMFAPATETPL